MGQTLQCDGQICQKDDRNNNGGMVAFCCTYRNGERTEGHCCNEEEYCKDNDYNILYHNECSNGIW